MSFDYFVILAGMRTGSNFLEANINEYPGLTCHGELYNPHFIGHAGKTEAFGTTLAEREADPMALLARVRDRTEGLAGFRLFHDHDPRVFAAVLADPTAAKIVLSRNPLESYVSLRIAAETGQWRLGDLKHAKSARIAFDPSGFARHLAGSRDYQDSIMRGLQASGQTAYFLTYEDVGEVEVMNGLARYLGVEEARKATSSKTKKQNPKGLEDKVTNYDEMLSALANVDHFDLARFPVFEPRRGPAVPGFVTAAKTPLLYMPIRSAPNGAINDWLARLDGVGRDALQREFNQKTLRQWMRKHPGFRSFTVLRHPVRRLHDAFCRHILATGGGSYGDLREVLKKQYKIPLPDQPNDPAYDTAAHRRTFAQFTRFIAGNLAGQSSVRVDPAWATQTAVVQGMAQFALPDHILREDELDLKLPLLAADIGATAPDWVPAEGQVGPHTLASIYDDEIERLVHSAYQRDYVQFGFGPLTR